VEHEDCRVRKGLIFLKYVNVNGPEISGINRKTLTDQTIEGLISLTSLAAKLLEGLEHSCLPKFTPMVFQVSRMAYD